MKTHKDKREEDANDRKKQDSCEKAGRGDSGGADIMYDSVGKCMGSKCKWRYRPRN